MLPLYFLLGFVLLALAQCGLVVNPKNANDGSSGMKSVSNRPVKPGQQPWLRHEFG